MDHTQFLQILETCVALPAGQREDLARATATMSPEDLQAFASKLLSLHAGVAAVAKRESGLLEQIEKVAKDGAKALKKNDRTQKESAAEAQEGEYLTTLLDQ
jgi:hypothetical protein